MNTPVYAYTLPTYPFVRPHEIDAGVASHHAVLIVGGGLAGLTLACSLARLGVKAVLLDEDDTVGVKGASSRGICYTQKSLEIFDKLGIYPSIAAKGIQWSVGRTFAGDTQIMSFDLAEQAAYNLSSQPPFINIQQFYVEGYLVDRTLQLGHVDLRWKSRVTAFAQVGDQAHLSVSTPAGDYSIVADYVIDATGANSRFRHWCQATTTAKKGDDRWCIADVRFAKHPPTERHTWIEAPFNDNRAVWQHLMGDDVWRIDYQMAPDADPAYVSREDVVRERLSKQFGADVEVDIVWVGPYAYRSECVDQMRRGAVFFMGDSAKVVSPFGARGGNTGIADADNLAWKLAAVLRQQAAPALLVSYHEERHEAATENVRVTNRTARFLRPADGVERIFRTAVIALAKKHPFAQQLVNTGRMAVANSYHFSSVITNTEKRIGGISVQNISIEIGTEHRTLNTLLNWANGNLLLLAFGPLNRSALAHLRRLSKIAPVRCVQVIEEGAVAEALEHVIDRNPRGSGQLRQACQLSQTGSGTAWALIRPDAYLAATGSVLNGSVVQALQKSLSL